MATVPGGRTDAERRKTKKPQTRLTPYVRLSSCASWTPSRRRKLERVEEGGRAPPDACGRTPAWSANPSAPRRTGLDAARSTWERTERGSSDARLNAPPRRVRQFSPATTGRGDVRRELFGGTGARRLSRRRNAHLAGAARAGRKGRKRRSYRRDSRTSEALKLGNEVAPQSKLKRGSGSTCASS